jgi:hypothetical protein
MSTDFRSLTQIRFAELFDGRLQDAGVYEHHSRNATSSERCLTDGVNFLWVFSNEEGLVSSFTRWAPNGSPERILGAIADEFDVEIVSELEPQFWGYETEKEWEEAWSAMAEKAEQKAKQDEQDFYNAVVKFVRGESHGIKSGTIEMRKAEIARQLTARAPHLLAENRRGDLIKAIEEVYRWEDREIPF